MPKTRTANKLQQRPRTAKNRQETGTVLAQRVKMRDKGWQNAKNGGKVEASSCNFPRLPLNAHDLPEVLESTQELP